MHRLRRSLSLLLLVGLLAVVWSPTHAQEQNSRYFPETGHWVYGEFLAYFDSAADPLLVFGYPITDAYQDPLTGLTIQYFQKVRFELHIEAETGKRVQISPLGMLLYEPGPVVEMSTDTPACAYFSDQQHYVCYSFKDFFYNNGGLAQFGAPLSELEQQGDLYVQYFERGRFEWHPELPAGQRVTLSDLGRLYFDQHVGDPALLAPNLVNGITQSLIDLRVRVFVANALVAPQGKQTVYIVAQDQYLRPVEKADVAVVVHLPNGGEQRYRLPLTDQNGISQYEFNVGEQPYDQIVDIAVEVAKGSLQATSSSWFRIWY